MTQLLSAAFDHTVTEAAKLKGSSGRARGAVILLVDEADALAQSREAAQMHHEDRAGVNAFIRGVGRLGSGRLPAAVIMCTNRLGALDPAVRRRAADILIFERPSEEQRHSVLADPLKQLGFSKEHIDAIVAATGPQNGRKQMIIPAESVYGVFEAKQSINAKHIGYEQEKVSSVRLLHRTSLPIPYAKGTYPPKPLIPILGGILAFESDWKPAFGQPLNDALSGAMNGGRLDLGCIAAHGHFSFNQETNKYENFPEGKPATAFLFKLISQLQFSGTVSMIDVQAYAQWLAN